MPRGAFERGEVHRRVGQGELSVEATPHYIAWIAAHYQHFGLGKQPRDQRQAGALERVHIDKALARRGDSRLGDAVPIGLAVGRQLIVARSVEASQTAGFGEESDVGGDHRRTFLERGDIG